MKIPLKYWLPGSFIFSIVLGEIILRFGLGLGNPPLVIPDEVMGYRFRENQNLRRFGNRLVYNQYSQRSEVITPEKDPDTLRILMVGDSVLNGGNRKDQTETISELWEARIRENQPQVEILNASANSWGIGNQWGYLQQYGLFNSDVVVLQIGTHDLIQPTSTAESLPDTPPPRFALQEAWYDYAWPRLQGKLFNSSSAPPTLDAAAASPNPEKRQEQQFRENLEALDAIASTVRAQDTYLFVLYTPNRQDVQPDGNKPLYKAEFFQHLEAANIAVVDSHEAWLQLPSETVESYFIDKVHLSVAGNDAIAQLLFQELCTPNKISACQN